MNLFHQLLNGIRTHKQRTLIMSMAMLSVLILTVPAAALPIIPVKPIIPDLFLGPSNLTAKAVSESEIDLAWKDNDNNEYGFYVERKVEGAGNFGNHAYLDANTTSFADTGLQPNTTYYYRVRAAGENGSSGYSNEASAKTEIALVQIVPKPLAPTDLAVTSTTCDTANLSWKDNSSNETHFFIHRKIAGAAGYTTVANVGPNITAFNDTGLAPETKYCYVVTAYNNSGLSPMSNEVSVTTPAIAPAAKPLAPTLLKAVPGGETTIDLTWQNNCTNETGFYIYRKTEGDANFAKVHDTSSGGWNGYGDSGLAPGTTYYYYVSAYNALGSADSNVISAATTGNPPSSTEVPPANTTTQEENVKPPANNPPSVNTMVLRFYIDMLQYYINDTPSPMDTAPVIKESRTLLPIRFVTTPLGANVGWEQATGKVTISHDGSRIEMWIGQNTALVNGVQKMIDPGNPNVTPIIMPPGRTMLPLRFISENLGCQVEWNNVLREAKVTYTRP